MAFKASPTVEEKERRTSYAVLLRELCVHENDKSLSDIISMKIVL